MGNGIGRILPEVQQQIVTAESSLQSTCPLQYRKQQQETQCRRSASLNTVIGRVTGSYITRITRSWSCTNLSKSASVRTLETYTFNYRPRNRVSRKGRRSSEYDCWSQSKAYWPVTNAEALFLPEFPVDFNGERDYIVEEHIANGAFGKVYKVCFSRKGTEPKHYALKVLSKAQVINNCAIKQLKEEVGIQTVCGHHPFLSECVRYWQNKTKIFLVSEYYTNGELFQKLTIFPLELARLYIAEIALALDFLHQAGIIYRDLKPENILIDRDFHVRLVDFGLSKWLSVGSRTRTLCGTLQYMGKELFHSIIAVRYFQPDYFCKILIA